MGRDCSLFVFPPNRVPRRCGLDRWHYMDEVYDALGMSGADSYDERVPAHRMLVAMETAALWTCEDRPDLMENAAHWRTVGAEYLRKAIKRWGADVPTMICEEEVFAEDYAPPAVVERMARWRKHRARAASHAKEKQDTQQNAIVQDWLTERRARQYDGTPALSFQEYLAKRKSSGGEGLEREGEPASGEEPREGYGEHSNTPTQRA